MRPGMITSMSLPYFSSFSLYWCLVYWISIFYFSGVHSGRDSQKRSRQGAGGTRSFWGKVSPFAGELLVGRTNGAVRSTGRGSSDEWDASTWSSPTSPREPELSLTSTYGWTMQCLSTARGQTASSLAAAEGVPRGEDAQETRIDQTHGGSLSGQEFVAGWEKASTGAQDETSRGETSETFCRDSQESSRRAIQEESDRFYQQDRSAKQAARFYFPHSILLTQDDRIQGLQVW